MSEYDYTEKPVDRPETILKQFTYIKYPLSDGEQSDCTQHLTILEIENMFLIAIMLRTETRPKVLNTYRMA